jgi:hypothetical protein
MLCFSLPVFGEETAVPSPSPQERNDSVEYALSVRGGSLWVEKEHGSGFRAASLSLKTGPLYAAVGTGGVFSDLPAFDTDYTGAWFNTSLNAAPQGSPLEAPLGIDLSGGFFHRDTLSAEVLGVPVESGDANRYFLRLGLPLHFGSWSAAPSLFFAQAFWEDGDLYWFFGKPRVPVLFAAGFSAAFREEHRVNFHYLSLDLDMLSPYEEKLLGSHFDGLSATYRWSVNRKPFRVGANAGWLFITGRMDGRLTAENQRYFIFPYIFYNIDFEARLHALFGVLEALYRQGIVYLKVQLGAAHILFGELAADVYSKEKTLSYLGIPVYTGREESFSLSLDPGGLGAAFLSIEGGLKDLSLGRKRAAPRLSLTVQKLFAVPWGYESIRISGVGDQNEPPGDKAPASAGESIDLMSILLSGLSFFCSITW